MIKPLLKIIFGLALAIGVCHVTEDIQAAMFTFLVTMIFFMEPELFRLKCLINKKK